jgi:phosphoribosyl-ATP pyrophosphohydrolase
MACEHENKDRAAEEISQLLYQTQILMLAAKVSIDDVYKKL